MNVTFQMLSEKTAEILGCTPPQIVGQLTGTIRSVSTRVVPSDAGEGALCVVTHLPKRTACFYFFIPGSAPDALPSGLSIAAFPEYISHGDLYRAACSALQFFLSFANAVLEKIAAGQSLSDIIAFVHPCFSNPILVYDSSLKVLAFTQNDGSTDRMWQETVQKGAVAALDPQGAAELLRYIDRLDRVNVPFRHTARDLSDPFYSCNILLDGKRVGMVDLMEHNHTISRGELGLLEGLCWLLSFAMQKEVLRRENSGLVYDHLLLDLLSGSIRDAKTLSSRLTATRWSPGVFTRVLRFEPEAAYIPPPEWDNIFAHLLTWPLEGRGIQQENACVFLLACKGSIWDAQQESCIDSFCQTHYLRCGISDAYADLLLTPRYAQQAQRALPLSAQRVVLFARVRCLNLFSLCAAQPHPEDYLHPAISMLAEHDRITHGDALETLCALMNCQYNQVAAARVLHIHRTTLAYRLSRIESQTGLSFSDAQDMMFLHFSLLAWLSRNTDS